MCASIAMGSALERERQMRINRKKTHSPSFTSLSQKWSECRARGHFLKRFVELTAIVIRLKTNPITKIKLAHSRSHGLGQPSMGITTTFCPRCLHIKLEFLRTATTANICDNRSYYQERQETDCVGTRGNPTPKTYINYISFYESRHIHCFVAVYNISLDKFLFIIDFGRLTAPLYYYQLFKRPANRRLATGKLLLRTDRMDRNYCNYLLLLVWRSFGYGIWAMSDSIGRKLVSCSIGICNHF